MPQTAGRAGDLWWNALQAQPRPGRPENIGALPISSTAIRIVANVDDGGSAIQKWQIRQATSIRDLVAATWTDISSSASSGLSHSITGLTASTTYFFQLRAFNAVGVGAETDSFSVTTEDRPIVRPGPVRSLAESSRGTDRITWGWSAPNTGDPATSYEYRVARGSAAFSGSWTTTNLSTSVTVTGLDDATSYRIQVRARNTAGPGNAATDSATTARAATAPEKPTGFSVVAAGRAFRLRAEANDGGSPITKWQRRGAATEAALASAGWTDIPNSASASVDWTSSNFGYSVRRFFQVRAVNAVDNGAVSDAASATTGAEPAAAPGKPSLTLTPGGQQMRLQASAANNRSAITRWRYRLATSAGGVASASWNTLSGATGDDLDETIGSLSYSTRYWVQVEARNGVGSTASDTEDATTSARPTASPGPVRSLAESSRGTDRITWGWDAPNTGDPATSYEYRIARGSAAFSGSWTTTNLSTSVTVTGLNDNTSYRIQVRARNTAGPGNAETDSATTNAALAPPGPVRSLAESAKTQTSITWGWDAPNTGGAVASYEYRVKLSSAGSFSGGWTDVVGATVTVTGLSASTAYDIQVRARNAAGPGSAETDSATTNAPPVVQDTTAPSFSSAETNRAGTKVTLFFDENLAANRVPAASAFTLSPSKTISGVSIEGSTVVLDLSSAFAHDDSITVRYRRPSSNRLQDASGNQTANFSGETVTNNVPEPAVRPGAIRNLVVDYFSVTFDDGETIQSFNFTWDAPSTGSRSTRSEHRNIFGSGTINPDLRWQQETGISFDRNEYVDLESSTRPRLVLQVREVNTAGAGPIAQVIVETDGTATVNYNWTGDLPQARAPSVVINPVAAGNESTAIRLSATLGNNGVHDGPVAFAWSVEAGTLDDATTERPLWTRPSVSADVDLDVDLDISVAGTGTEARANTSDSSSAATVQATVRNVATAPPPPRLENPGPVRSLAESAKTQTSITWGWDAPNTGGAVASYEYRVKLSSAGSFSGGWTDVVGATVTVTGLSASTAYDIQVRARNAAGPGNAETDSATTDAAGSTTRTTTYEVTRTTSWEVSRTTTESGRRTTTVTGNRRTAYGGGSRMTSYQTIIGSYNYYTTYDDKSTAIIRSYYRRWTSHTTRFNTRYRNTAISEQRQTRFSTDYTTTWQTSRLTRWQTSRETEI